MKINIECSYPILFWLKKYSLGSAQIFRFLFVLRLSWEMSSPTSSWQTASKFKPNMTKISNLEWAQPYNNLVTISYQNLLQVHIFWLKICPQNYSNPEHQNVQILNGNRIQALDFEPPLYLCKSQWLVFCFKCIKG